jgi:hypothetical protein
MSKVIPEGLHGNKWFDLQCPKTNIYYIISRRKFEILVQHSSETNLSRKTMLNTFMHSSSH